MEKQELLRNIQAYSFAAYDLLLYLDTHPDDKKAFRLFSETVKKTKSLIEKFEEKFGPLTAFAASNSDCFNWLKSPWPWEKEANK